MTDTPKPATSSASRYLFILLIGLVIGAVATVMLMRALQERRDPFPASIMHVMAKQTGMLKLNTEQNRCAVTDTLPRLQSLRVLANDLELAFPSMSTDKRFVQHASQMRATMDALIASPPMDCSGLSNASVKIGETCKSCHQDFR